MRFQIGSIKRKHYGRGPYLSQIKDVLLAKFFIWSMKNAAGYHPGQVASSAITIAISFKAFDSIY
jgi:hypothetical protein